MKLRADRGTGRGLALYFLGRLLQVTGLMVTLVAATAFFGTPSTIAMLRMMLVGRAHLPARLAGSRARTRAAEERAQPRCPGPRRPGRLP